MTNDQFPKAPTQEAAFWIRMSAPVQSVGSKELAMTREEAIKLLTSEWRGVQGWNEWRRENEPPPDLTKADFADVNLRGVNLSGVDLFGVTFVRTNLVDAILVDADLSRSVASDADLRGANLGRVNFKDADLRGADLTDADIF